MHMQITKTADGYQPHLVSPERGLRLMAARALDQVEGPVAACVAAVYAMLVGAAREAAAAAGEHTEAATSGKAPLHVPEFKNFVMPAVVRALDEWRGEAEGSEYRWGVDRNAAR
jgi:dynamin GTPase